MFVGSSVENVFEKLGLEPATEPFSRNWRKLKILGGFVMEAGAKIVVLCPFPNVPPPVTVTMFVGDVAVVTTCVMLAST